MECVSQAAFLLGGGFYPVEVERRFHSPLLPLAVEPCALRIQGAGVVSPNRGAIDFQDQISKPDLVCQ